MAHNVDPVISGHDNFKECFIFNIFVKNVPNTSQNYLSRSGKKSIHVRKKKQNIRAEQKLGGKKIKTQTSKEAKIVFEQAQNE